MYPILWYKFRSPRFSSESFTVFKTFIVRVDKSFASHFQNDRENTALFKKVYERM